MPATYRDIKAEILRRITSGDWPPGTLLPSETELAERHDCARATVNRAMRELADDGIVERKRKAGTRVRSSPLRQARFDIPLVRDQIEGQGATYRYALVSRAEVAAPDWLRARLGLDDNGRALHLTCMHYADGNPYQHEDRWINLAVLPEARQTDFTVTGPNEWLVATIPFSDVEISFSAVTAGRALAEHLACVEGAALFRIERSTWFESRAVTFVRMSFREGYRMTTRY